MSKKQKDQTITINDKDYQQSDLNQEQLAMINHITDLDRKIQSSNFNIEQLNFGREAFMQKLTQSLET